MMPGKKRKATRKAPAAKKQRKLSEEALQGRPKKYRNWSDVSMAGAMQAVIEGRMGVNRAAEEYGVPKTTLKDRLAGRVEHGCTSGRARYLSRQEEEELVEYLVTCSEIGFPKRRDDVIGIVRKTVGKKNNGPIKNFNGKGWWWRFLQRWPNLALRKGDALTQNRANAVTSDNFKQYFNVLEKTLKEHDLFNAPHRIFNMDETGMPLDHKPKKVVALKGAKKVHCRTSGNKSQVTVLACANAAGSILPPMVIFDGKRLNPEYTKGEVPNTLYGLSDKGWTDQELFKHWMTDLFLPNIPPARPVMLLLDGHSSHYEPHTIRLAAQEGVVILCLPPHTTHVSQPLDVSFFAPLKMYWSEACHLFMQENPGRVVTKYQFSSLFSTAWYKAIKPATLVAGFKKVGVCPFNSSAIAVCDPPSVTTLDVSEDDNSSYEDENEDVSLPEVNTEASATNSSFVRTENASFTPEQLQIFETRYENGYA